MAAVMSQNKILPGVYINFVSAVKASATLSERGYAAMPLTLDWGPVGEIFSMDAADFHEKSMEVLGHAYNDEVMKNLRELFNGIRTGYFYRLNRNGEKAANKFATARYPGSRGNDITVVIELNGKATDEDKIFDVITVLETTRVDVQIVRVATELVDNQYVSFLSDVALELTAGTPLTGGTDGEVTNADYQDFLDKVEAYSFNALGCPSSDDTVKGLFAAFTKRKRDDEGVKFQCVVHQYTSPDYEGVISVENNDKPELIYWVTGAEAGCPVNESVSNKIYTGEYDVNTNYTQIQMEEALKSGKLLFYRVGDTVRVLEDVNTLVSLSLEKNRDFSSNQTIRVLDQIANDIAELFTSGYRGKIPNNNAGRIALWNDIVKHHKELESSNAIENFDPEKLTVRAGDSKKSVVIEDFVTPVNAMSQLYMTVIVE